MDVEALAISAGRGTGMAVFAMDSRCCSLVLAKDFCAPESRAFQGVKAKRFQVLLLLADWSLRWTVLIALLGVGLALWRPKRAGTTVDKRGISWIRSHKPRVPGSIPGAASLGATPKAVGVQAWGNARLLRPTQCDRRILPASLCLTHGHYSLTIAYRFRGWVKEVPTLAGLLEPACSVTSLGGFLRGLRPFFQFLPRSNYLPSASGVRAPVGGTP